MLKETRFSHKKNNEFTFGWWLLTIFISFIISIGIIWVIHIIWHPSMNDMAEIIPNSIDNIFKTNPDQSKLPSIKNKIIVLAMGVDSNGRGTDPFKGTRTDVMIVTALDPVNKTINAISIPRDSKVFLADSKGVDKINAAHAYGGPELAVKTVEETLGINIDYYMVIDYAGLKELVKALGGVEVYVEKEMRYTDRSARLFIDLKPGKQLLDAEHAEMYLRFRHDPEADIGRIKRQQWFLKGVIEKLKNPTIIFKIPQLIELSKRYTQTDMSLGTMLKIAGFVKDVDFKNIQVATLPGYPSQNSRVSYWLVDVNKAQVLVDRLIYGYENSETAEVPEGAEETPITLSILYNSEKEEALTGLLTEIEQTNYYKIVCKNRTREPHTKIISHTNRATLNETKHLRDKLSEFNSAPIFLSPDEIYCAPSDYTIVLGKDQ